MKRFALPFIEDLMSSLFETLCQNDLNNINRNIEILSDNQDCA